MPPEKRERNAEIAADYNAGQMTIEAMRKKYKISRATLMRILEMLENRQEITPRPERIAARKVTERRRRGEYETTD